MFSQEIKSYRSGTTRGWVNTNDNIQFWVDCPFKITKFYLNSHTKIMASLFFLSILVILVLLQAVFVLTRHLQHPHHTQPQTGKCHRWTSPSVHSPPNPRSLLEYTKTRQDSISYQRFDKYYLGQDEQAITVRLSLSLSPTQTFINRWRDGGRDRGQT